MTRPAAILKEDDFFVANIKVPPCNVHSRQHGLTIAGIVSDLSSLVCRRTNFPSILQMGMELKELGTTGAKVPEVGIGTYRYEAGPGLLRKAVELGAFLIDTAESYNNEEVVGQAIQGIRNRVFVATKTRHWKYAEVLRSAEGSLRRLGIDSIDLYQLHWPNAAVPIAETMAAMETLVDQGKVRFLGVSNFSVPELKKAQAVMRKYQIVSNQVRYSLVDRSIQLDVLPYCQRNHVTVIAHTPLAEGLRNILSFDSQDVLGQLAGVTGKTRAQIALNWCVSQPGVVTIPKTHSLEHLSENCGSSGWRLTEEQMAMLDKGVHFRRRSRFEARFRRFARNTLQRLGRP